MPKTISNPQPATVPYLDCERLDCYRCAIEFQTIAARLAPNKRLGTLRDQLDRASGLDRPEHLDLLLARGLIAPSTHRHGRGLLIRIVQMLTRLTERSNEESE